LLKILAEKNHEVTFKAASLQIHANFHENFENVFECVIFRTLSMALTNHVNYQKVDKICIIL
jgi:hypothetical protein